MSSICEVSSLNVGLAADWGIIRIFCVGVSTAFGIITSLDRLMVATKMLVGEQYHIHGVGVSLRSAGMDIGPRSRTLDSFKNGEV
jgi:tetrahydromethanopterin S-methyltransferase subunit D